VLATLSTVERGTGDGMQRIGVFRDISREHELRFRVIREQKFRTLGSLAAGVAHNINNRLTPVLGWTEMLLERLAAGETLDHGELVHALTVINQGASDSVGTVRRLQEYARPGRVKGPEAVHLREVLEHLLAALGELWTAGELSITAERFGSNLVRGHLAQLMQVAPPRLRAERVLVGCAPGEQHDLGPLMLALFLRRSGFDVVYLGANVEAGSLASDVRRLSPAALCLGASTALTVPALADLFRCLSDDYSGVLAFGGQAFIQHPECIDTMPGLYLGPDAATAHLSTAGERASAIGGYMRRNPSLPVGLTMLLILAVFLIGGRFFVDLEAYRQQLLQMRERLNGDVSHLADEALRATGGEASGSLSNAPLHPADLGTDNYEQELSLGLLQNQEQTPGEIAEALERMQKGSYGECEECRGPIPRPRLQALPAAAPSRYWMTKLVAV